MATTSGDPILDEKIARYATQFGVPTDLAMRLIQHESGFNPNAVSPKGARGLGQIRPATGQSPGWGIPPLDTNNPDDNLRLSMQYLAKMNELKGGDWREAVKAYNAGPGRPEKADMAYVGRVMQDAPEQKTVRMGDIVGGSQVLRMEDIVGKGPSIGEGTVRMEDILRPSAATPEEKPGIFAQAWDAAQRMWNSPETAAPTTNEPQPPNWLQGMVTQAPPTAPVPEPTPPAPRNWLQRLVTQSPPGTEIPQKREPAPDSQLLPLVGLGPGLASDWLPPEKPTTTSPEKPPVTSLAAAKMALGGLKGFYQMMAGQSAIDISTPYPEAIQTLKDFVGGLWKPRPMAKDDDPTAIDVGGQDLKPVLYGMANVLSVGKQIFDIATNAAGQALGQEKGLEAIQQVGVDSVFEGLLTQAANLPPEDLPFAADATYNTLQFIGQSAPSLLIGAVTRRKVLPAMAVFSSQVYEGAKAQGIAQGLEGPAVNRYAALQTLTEAIPELLPTVVLMSSWNKEIVKKFGLLFLADVSGENASSVGNLFVDLWEGLDKDVTTKEVLEAMRSSTVGSIGSSLFFGLARGGGTGFLKLLHNLKGKVRPEAIEGILGKLEAARVLPDDPTVRELIAKIREGHQAKAEEMVKEAAGIAPVSSTEWVPDQSASDAGESIIPIWRNPLKNGTVELAEAPLVRSRTVQPYVEAKIKGLLAETAKDTTTVTPQFRDIAARTLEAYDKGILDYAEAFHIFDGVIYQAASSSSPVKAFDTYREALRPNRFTVHLGRELQPGQVVFVEPNPQSPNKVHTLQTPGVKRALAARAMRKAGITSPFRVSATKAEQAVADNELYLQAVRTSVEQWLQDFVPTAAAIIDGQRGKAYAQFHGVAIQDNGTVALRFSIPNENKTNPLKVFHALGHEFGHGLTIPTLDAMPQYVQDAVRAEYRQWYQETWREKRGELGAFVKGRGSPYEVSKVSSPLAIKVAHVNNDNWHKSFIEYAADAAARYVIRRPLRGITPETQPYFDRLGGAFQDFYKKYGPPEESLAVEKGMTIWMEELMLRGIESKYHDSLDRQWKDSPADLWESLQSGNFAEVQKAMEDLLVAPRTSPLSPSAVGEHKINPANVYGEPILAGLTPQAQTEIAYNLSTSLTKFGWFRKKVETLLQLAEENPHVLGFQDYMGNVRAWNVVVTETLALADQRLKEFHKLFNVGPYVPHRDAFARFRMAVTTTSERVQQKLPRTKAHRQLLVQTLKAQQQSFITSGATADAKEMARKIRQMQQPISVEEIASKYGILQVPTPTGTYTAGNVTAPYPSMLEFSDSLDADFDAALTGLYDSLREQAQAQWAHDPTEMLIQILKLNREEAVLRDRDYTPSSRFGQYMVVTLKALPSGGNKLLMAESFETVGEAKRRIDEINAGAVSGISAEMRLLTDMERSLVEMPPSLVRRIGQQLALSPEKTSELAQILFELSPARSFAKRRMHRNLKPGYSLDLERGYAAYFMSFAHNLGRVKFGWKLAENIKDIKGQAAGLEAREHVRMMGLAQWAADHREYILTPGEEWAHLRALIFMWHLAFVPQSALMNLTQLGLATAPYLGKRFNKWFSPMAAERMLGKVAFDYRKMLRGNPVLEKELLDALDKASTEGFLSESLATEIAGVSQGSTLQKLMPGRALGSRKLAYGLRRFTAAGTWMFQTTEQFNRYVTFGAAFRLMRDQLLRPIPKAQRTQADIDAVSDAAYNFARQAVDDTQFEYARWNRPEIARGKPSIFFIFKMYPQGMLWYMMKNKGGWRYWLALALWGGIEGYPESEAFLEILGAIASQYKKATGAADPYTDMRLTIRDLASDIALNPDLAVHGLSRYSFGLSFLGQGIGLPIPAMDFSGSIGLNRIVPGLTPLIKGMRAGDLSTAESRDVLLRATADVAGPLPSLFYDVFAATLLVGDTERTRAVVNALPKVLKSSTQTYQWWNDGAVKDSSGAKLLEFDPYDSTHKAELIAKGLLQANPAALGRVREMDWAMRQRTGYYSTWRETLAHEYHQALVAGDQEALREAEAELMAYDEMAPPEFKLNRKSFRQGLSAREKSRQMFEQYGVRGGRASLIPEAERVQDLFRAPGQR